MTQQHQAHGSAQPLSFMTEDELMVETMDFKGESDRLFAEAQRASRAGLSPFRNDPEAFMHFVRRGRALRDELAERLLGRASAHDGGATAWRAAVLDDDDDTLGEAKGLQTQATADLIRRWAMLGAQILSALQDEACRQDSEPTLSPCLSLPEYGAYARRAAAIEEELGRRWTEEQRRAAN